MDKANLIEKIKEFYDYESLKNIGNIYFTQECLNAEKKSDFAAVYADYITDKEKFKLFFNSLDEKKKEILKETIIVELKGVEEIYAKYETSVTNFAINEKFTFNYTKGKILPEYSFFKYEPPGYWDKESAGIVYIDSTIACAIRENFGAAEVKIPSEEVTAKSIFSFDGDFFNFFRKICSYYMTMSQTQKEKLLKNDVKEFRDYLEIDELYDKRSENSLMRSTIILSFLNCVEWSKEKVPETDEEITDFFRRFFESKIEYRNEKFSVMQNMAKHIRGFNSIWEGNEKIDKIIAGIKEILILNRGKWISSVSAYQLIRKLGYREDIINYETTCNYLYVNSKDYGKLKIMNRKLYEDVIMHSFLNNILLMLGAFGIISIGYDEPLEETFYGIGSGVKFIKTREAGEYILGIKDSITVQEEQKTKIEADLDRKIVLVKGDAPAERMVLDRCGERIGEDSYYISFTTITKDCKTRIELEEKAELLREKIIPNPEGVWREFFDSLLTKIVSFEEENSYRVFKIKNIKTAEFFAKDHVIKELCIKAEGMRVLIEKENICKIKSRMRELGCFWELND